MKAATRKTNRFLVVFLKSIFRQTLSNRLKSLKGINRLIGALSEKPIAFRRRLQETFGNHLRMLLDVIRAL